MSEIRERQVKSISGVPFLLFLPVIFIVGLFLIERLTGTTESTGIRAFLTLGGPVILIALCIALIGLYKVEPNQSAVLSLFGKYVGTVREPGLRLNNPFYTKKKVSLRVRNFESGKLKVNELEGSPIEIAAIVVWEVNDSAEAVFNVDNYESFVQIQRISERLRDEIQDRLTQAGIHVIEARISHLAYSPEIAGAMLQRQQAGAIIAARKKIVEGAVGMVEDAIEGLSAKNIIELDEERKATMVSNLLVVLCSDKATQPVVNTGSLY